MRGRARRGQAAGPLPSTKRRRSRSAPLAARAAEVLLVEETASGALRERRRFALGAGSAA